jgi:hypothetical protein
MWYGNIPPRRTPVRDLASVTFPSAAVVAVSWMPFFGLLLFQVPQVEPLLRRVEERGDLPVMTNWLLSVGRYAARRHEGAAGPP